MSEAAFLYLFLVVMTVQLAASVIYLVGFSQIRVAVRRSIRGTRR